ncbi:SRPBCC family protein [Cohnella rhizosphaerae]|uniref:SRPBCC domain-containing protein n=1 Tax=Cohnella rhizosphaerae TaxID=1457232 RepID=A0A9X4L5C9_9BACL|nr:SRPBCC domain-containing protein [Cohnella rhizosphaerae]MDG0814164.1 SRPBCC domain-containing protein [Cohnella rhizosphaerae]
MNQNGTNQPVTRVDGRTFIMERVFDAPREMVYEAFVNPDLLAKWWAPKPYTIPVCRIDLRPGGKWHYCMRSPEGQTQWVLGIYEEIHPLERISYAVTFADEQANPTDVIPKQEVTVRFADAGDGRTTLVLNFRLPTEEELQATLKMGMSEGTAMALDNLAQDVLPQMKRG